MDQVIYSTRECLVAVYGQGNIKIIPKRYSAWLPILLSFIVFIPWFWASIGSPSSAIGSFKELDVNWLFLSGSIILLPYVISPLKFLFGTASVELDLVSRNIRKGKRCFASFSDANSVHVRRCTVYGDDVKSYRYDVYLLLNDGRSIDLVFSSGFSPSIREESDADTIAKEIANILSVYIAKKSWRKSA